MITRRVMLQAGVGFAASSVALTELSHGRSMFTPGASQQPHAVVIAAESADALVFGHAAGELGLPLHKIHADLTDLYCQHLAPHWRQHGPAPVIGMTGAAPLFYLERLAWDVKMRVVFLGRHPKTRDAGAEHTFTGPRSVVDALSDTARVFDWRMALAHVLTQMPTAVSSIQPPSAARDAAIAADSALFSWVLAPVRGEGSSGRLRVSL